MSPTVRAWLSLLAVDLSRADSLAAADATAIVADTDVVYTAAERVYVATNPVAWGRAPGDVGDPKIIRKSDIHAFDITGAHTAYLGSGAVRGFVPFSSALSEYDGDLRVFAREADKPNAAFSSARGFVAVMHRQKGTLEQVGRIRGFRTDIYDLGWLGDLVADSDGSLQIADVSKTGRRAPHAAFALPGFSGSLNRGHHALRL